MNYGSAPGFEDRANLRLRRLRLRDYDDAPGPIDDGSELELYLADGSVMARGAGAPYPVIRATERALEVNGALLDGVTDDSAAIQAALDSLSGSARGRIAFPPGVFAKINSGLTVVAGVAAIDFAGAQIDCSGMTSGYALTIAPYEGGAPFSRWARGMPIQNLMLIGPNSEANNTDGIFIGRTGATGNVTGLSLQNIQVLDFRDCLYIGDQAFILQLLNVNLEGAWRYGFHYVAETNAGENISWMGGRVSDCIHSGGSAIGIYMPASDATNKELFTFGVSCVYNDQGFRVEEGVLSMFGAHIEGDDNSNPFGEVVWTSGNAPTGVNLIGGSVSPRETAGTSRAALFTVQGDDAYFNAQMQFRIWDHTSQIVTIPSGNPRINLEGTAPFIGSEPAPTQISPELNRFLNGDFELNNLNGWSNQGTGWTFGASSAQANNGTYSASCVGTGAGSGSIRQYCPVKPGQWVYLKAAINVTAISAGNVFLTSRFYKHDPGAGAVVQVGSNAQVYGASATSGGWVERSRKYRVPPGATHYYFQLNGDASFNGTAYLDDVEVYVL